MTTLSGGGRTDSPSASQVVIDDACIYNRAVKLQCVTPA